jgi:hypothetical protein
MTTPEEQEAYDDYIVQAWEFFANTHQLPLEACEEEHEAYRIYEGWLALYLMTEEYVARLAESGG